MDIEAVNAAPQFNLSVKEFQSFAALSVGSVDRSGSEAELLFGPFGPPTGFVSLFVGIKPSLVLFNDFLLIDTPKGSIADIVFPFVTVQNFNNPFLIALRGVLN